MMKKIKRHVQVGRESEMYDILHNLHNVILLRNVI